MGSNQLLWTATTVMMASDSEEAKHLALLMCGQLWIIQTIVIQTESRLPGFVNYVLQELELC